MISCNSQPMELCFHVCTYCIVQIVHIVFLFIVLNVDGMFELGSSSHTVILPSYVINNSEA